MATHPVDTASPRPDEPAEATTGSELARVEADIARTREQVSRSVSALRDAVVRRTDWREWVRRRPGLFMAAAFVLGFVWGGRRALAPSERGHTPAKRRGTWK